MSRHAAEEEKEKEIELAALRAEFEETLMQMATARLLAEADKAEAFWRGGGARPRDDGRAARGAGARRRRQAQQREQHHARHLGGRRGANATQGEKVGRSARSTRTPSPRANKVANARQQAAAIGRVGRRGSVMAAGAAREEEAVREGRLPQISPAAARRGGDGGARRGVAPRGAPHHEAIRARVSPRRGACGLSPRTLRSARTRDDTVQWTAQT